MKVSELLKLHKGNNKKYLDEAESKKILKGYNIPVVKEEVAANLDILLDKSKSIGYPLVLKALGSNIIHKTEKGLVRLGLKNKDSLLKAAKELKKAAGDDFEGYLVQPYLTGKREFVAGLFYDRIFGPVVMFGLGGIFTEAIHDVSFGICPLNRVDALSMIQSIKSKKLLDNYRSEKAVDKEELVKILMGLSDFAMENPEVKEVDINPLIISETGTISAVDSLVILGREETKTPPKNTIDPYELGKFFYPESIAFVGASSKFGKWGNHLFTNTIKGGYQGKVYLVNPKAESIAGRKVYKSLKDIPGPVNLAIVCIPAKHVIDLIPDLKAKETKGMLLITSGFKEAGKEGQELENQLVQKAKEAEIYILGPNTMGICNPHIKLFCNAAHVYPVAVFYTFNI